MLSYSAFALFPSEFDVAPRGRYCPAMGHNPSRYTSHALDAADQAAVDAHKSRSVWGAWWKLGEVAQSRFFTDGQRRFIRRYGARLDELASLVTAPRNEAEQHFVRVCNGELSPSNANERLWLLVQLVCRYEAGTERAVRVSIAETRADALEGEIHGLRMSQREDAHYIMELIRDLQMATGEMAPVRGRLSKCNVEHATLLFRRPDGSAPIRACVANPTFRWTPLVVPGSNSAISQGPSPA